MIAYTIKVHNEPSAPDDPIPWAYAVYDGEQYLGGGWTGTEREALQYGRDWLRDYLVGEGE